LFIGQNESLLIIGTEAAPIEKVLAHMTGGSVPSLGDLAAYDQNRLSMFREAPLYGWANAKSLMDALTHKGPKQDADTPDPFAMLSPSKILPAVGLAGVKTLGFSMQIGNDGTTMQVFASVPEESRQGLLKALPGAKDSTPPAFVPADAVKFQRWRIDGQKAWATLQKVAADISPQVMSYINFALTQVNELAKQKDPNFDINKNLFGNLGDDVISYQKAPKGNTLAELNSAPSLVLIGSPNAEQFESALKYLLSLANQQAATPEEREFLGRKIYSVPLPASPIPSANLGAAIAKPRKLNYAASGGYLALSTDASMVEEYLRSSDGQHKALRDTPGLTDAMAKAGGASTGMFGYENQTETTRALFETLKNGAATNSSGASMMPFGTFSSTDTFKDWSDFSLLPSYDSVSKYFGMSVYTISANVDGLLFKMFAPVPPGLRK
jgi:hypothetical protein